MTKKINMEIISPFLEGTIETLSIQCSLDIEKGLPFVKKSGEDGYRPDIAALISISTEGFCGTISLLFKKEVFIGIMNQFLGESNSVLTDEIEDGAAELLNIIFGYGKRILNKSGHKIQKAIPSIIRGENMKLSYQTKFSTIVLPFRTMFGEFVVEITTDH